MIFPSFTGVTEFVKSGQKVMSKPVVTSLLELSRKWEQLRTIQQVAKLAGLRIWLKADNDKFCSIITI